MLPSVCRHAKAGDEPCRIGVDHHRDRKTGPAFAIAVLECRTHGQFFTLYPLGHYPYGRAAAAPVAPDGEPLYSHADGQPPSLAWETTLFAPVFALAEGPKPGPADPGAWWATEPPDRLALPAAVLGLQVAERLGDAIAEQLGIARLELHQADRDYRAARGPAAHARVLLAVLSRLPPDRCLLDRLVGSGALAGCWGSVERWDRGRHEARRRLFPGRGMPDG